MSDELDLHNLWGSFDYPEYNDEVQHVKIFITEKEV